MLGKSKCRILKEIRQKIADENDIPYVTRECTYQGECKGTCPRCEQELRYLEEQLERRRRMGKTVAVTALCAGLTLGAAGCADPLNQAISGLRAPVDFVKEKVQELLPGGRDTAGEVEVLEGAVACPDPTEEPTEVVELSGEVAEPEPDDRGEPVELSGDVAWEPEDGHGGD